MKRFGPCERQGLRAQGDADPWTELGRRVGPLCLKEGTIANLLRNEVVEPRFATLDADRLARLGGRLESSVAIWEDRPESIAIGFLRNDAQAFEDFEAELSAPVLDAVLERIDVARGSVIAGEIRTNGARPRGRWLVHRFGRSLETGEAEVSSRHFFDSWDRPPLSLWIDSLSRPLPHYEGAYETALLCFVPSVCLARASAGRRICPNGSLFFLDEIDCELSDQVGSFIDLRSNRPGIG